MSKQLLNRIIQKYNLKEGMAFPPRPMLHIGRGIHAKIMKSPLRKTSPAARCRSLRMVFPSTMAATAATEKWRKSRKPDREKGPHGFFHVGLLSFLRGPIRNLLDFDANKPYTILVKSLIAGLLPVRFYQDSVQSSSFLFFYTVIEHLSAPEKGRAGGCFF